MQLWDLLWFEWQFFSSRFVVVVSVALFCVFHYNVFRLQWKSTLEWEIRKQYWIKKFIEQKRRTQDTPRGRVKANDTHTQCPRSIIFLENNIKRKTHAYHFFLFCSRKILTLECSTMLHTIHEHEHDAHAISASMNVAFVVIVFHPGMGKQTHKPFSNERITAKIIRSFEARAGAKEKKMEIKPNIISAWNGSISEEKKKKSGKIESQTVLCFHLSISYLLHGLLKKMVFVFKMKIKINFHFNNFSLYSYVVEKLKLLTTHTI